MSAPGDLASRMAKYKKPALRDLPLFERIKRALVVCEQDLAVAVYRAATHKMIKRRVGAHTDGLVGTFDCNLCGATIADYGRGEPLSSGRAQSIKDHGAACAEWRKWEAIATMFPSVTADPVAAAVLSDWLSENGWPQNDFKQVEREDK